MTPDYKIEAHFLEMMKQRSKKLFSKMKIFKLLWPRKSDWAAVVGTVAS